MNKKQTKNLKKVSEKEYLTNLLEQFIKLQAGSRSRIERYEDLSRRTSFNKLNEAKKTQIKNRLEQAKLEYTQSFEIIDSIKNKLEQL